MAAISSGVNNGKNVSKRGTLQEKINMILFGY